MKKIKNISVIVIVFNEEKKIFKCLSKLINFEEIIVVDSFSTDTTVSICKKFPNVKIFQNKFINYSDQRNWAVKKAKNDWVFHIDADEELSGELCDEVVNIRLDDHTAYYVSITEYMYGKKMMFTGYNKSQHIRLYNRIFYLFNGGVHENIISIGLFIKKFYHFGGEIFHHSHDTVFDTIQGYNTYTELEFHRLAETYKKHGVLWICLSMLFEINKQFVGRYIVKKGFRDGTHGFVESLLRSIYPIISYSKYLITRFG